VRRARTLALGVAIALLAAAPALGAPAAGPASLVDTRDGSLGAGFPAVGATLPFGMIQPGPDTALANGAQDPVNYVGYAWQDPDIRGFSLTHFDGAGIQIAGDLPFMPTTGAIDPTDFASPYSHAGEVARPGYYAVTLARYGIRVQLSATTRAAIMRLRFPPTSSANLLALVSQSIDGAHPGSVTILGDQRLEGWVRSDVGYRVYFAARFDRPFDAHGTWTGTATAAGSRAATGDPVGAYLSFDTRHDPVVVMRVAISYVDQAGAWGNLQAEMPAARSFERIEAAARAAWNRRLDAVQISGGTLAERETFYDNLYRALLLPAVFDDADGRYLGFDGVVHRVAPGQHHYSDLSLWDVYRSQLPLLELIAPRVAHDVLLSLISDADQNHGVIPRWVQANIDRGIMAGDSGSAALADGAAEGLLSPAQARDALALLVHQATTLPPVWPREHLDAYLRYGYVPYDIDSIGASETLEYDIDDNAIAQLAAALGQSSDAALLAPRAEYWRNLVDPSTRFIRPRNSNGTWADPTTLGDPTGLSGISTPVRLPYSPDFQDGYQEGTGWQYLWSVPQDPAGLAQAIGGRAVALRRLDRFFSAALDYPALPAVALAHDYGGFFGVYYIGDQYTSVNEPDLWAPWFYDFYGQPWKAQRVARAEMAAYNQTPAGMPGNDDAGELSAWYVLAALGLYHVAPGVDAWELSSPAFAHVVLGEGARTLVIDAPGASSTSFYVDRLTLDGAPLTRSYLTSCQLRAGGTLDFALSSAPDRGWATGPGAAPPSASAPSPAVDACAARLTAGGAP
jgi:predicted alpha-1,2-mannosidase